MQNKKYVNMEIMAYITDVRPLVQNIAFFWRIRDIRKARWQQFDGGISHKSHYYIQP